MATASRKRLMTEGDILPIIVKFSIPLILSALIQILFKAADKAVLAQLGGVSDVASINAIGTVVNLIITSLNGLSHGAVILLSHAIGRKDDGAIRRINNTAFITAAFLGLLIAVFGACAFNIMPSWVNCPKTSYHGAALYLLFTFIGAPFLLIYNFSSAALRATGDSKSPTYYLIVSGVANLVLNIILCLILPQKVIAVALATMLSHLISAALCLRKLRSLGDPYIPDFRPRNFRFATFLSILKVGLPCALEQALFSLGTLPATRAMNSFGDATITGNGAAMEIEGFTNAFISGFGSSSLTFIGQNYGAGKKDRIAKGTVIYLIGSTVLAFSMTGLVFLFRIPMLKLFINTDDAELALAVGCLRTVYIMVPYVINALKNLLANIVQGLGHTIPGTVNKLLNVVVFRVIWMTFIFPLYPKVACIYQCYVVSWMLLFIFDLVIFLYYARKEKIFKKEENTPSDQKVCENA